VEFSSRTFEFINDVSLCEVSKFHIKILDSIQQQRKKNAINL